MWAVYGPQPSIAPMEYAKLMHNTGHGYGVATFNLNSRTGQPNTTKYGIAYGHLGATYGYQSIMAHMPGLEITLVISTNMETQEQVQPADTFCFAYGATLGLYVGRELTCKFKNTGNFSGGCTCDTVEWTVIV